MQVIDYAEGVDTGHQRYGEKFELFRASIGDPDRNKLSVARWVRSYGVQVSMRTITGIGRALWSTGHGRLKTDRRTAALVTPRPGRSARSRLCCECDLRILGAFS